MSIEKKNILAEKEVENKIDEPSEKKIALR